MHGLCDHFQHELSAFGFVGETDTSDEFSSIWFKSKKNRSYNI